MSILLNKTIRLFLDSIGRRDEYEYYLEKFRGDNSKAFALVCPIGDDFTEFAPVFTFDLNFLLRLELAPVILLCGPGAMKIRNSLFLGKHPFSAHLVDISGRNISDHTAEILELLDECRQRSRIMVLVDPSTTLEDALRHIVPAVSNRIHFVRSRGPLHTKDGESLFYYCTRGYEAPELEDADKGLAEVARRLLNLNQRLHISAASPLHLLQELFTVKGAGCVIRAGYEIHHYSRISLVEENRLIELLADSFGRCLADVSFLQNQTDIYIEHGYNGAMLLEPYQDSMYISKFAVRRLARGEGLAQDLWRRTTAEHTSLFWRSRVSNNINHWYEKLADGFHRTDKWKIYWKGVDPMRIPDFISFAEERGDDFAEEAEG